MNLSTNTIKTYLTDQKYTVPADETYSHIDEWLEWYQNDVKKFHHYKLYNGSIMTEACKAEKKQECAEYHEGHESPGKEHAEPL